MADDVVVAPVPTHAVETGDKGLKTGALGFVSSVVIGVASTAPGYSLAATLGFVVAAVGFQAPAIMWSAFVPMFLIAAAYYYMNRADPDCGTTFTWVTRAIGPQPAGSAAGRSSSPTCIVMANLAQIAGLYTFLLFGADGAARATFWVTFVGVIWIVGHDRRSATIGIELSARTQWFLLAAEILTLALFAVVALIKVYAGNPPADSVHSEPELAEPVRHQHVERARLAACSLAVFIYWGWDTAVSVNEETEDATRTPGKAAVVSTVHPARDLRDRLDRGPGLPRRRSSWSTTRTTCSARSAPTSSARRRQAADHRRADVRVRLDADDDPARPRARRCRWRRTARCPKYCGRIHPRFLTPARLDDLDGRGLDRLVRRR